jgi:hypothetical protein
VNDAFKELEVAGWREPGRGDATGTGHVIGAALERWAASPSAHEQVQLRPHRIRRVRAQQGQAHLVRGDLLCDNVETRRHRVEQLVAHLHRALVPIQTPRAFLDALDAQP